MQKSNAESKFTAVAKEFFSSDAKIKHKEQIYMKISLKHLRGVNWNLAFWRDH